VVIRYSNWDGSQNVNPFDADDLLEAISDDVIRDGDLRRALERIMKRGADLKNGRMPGMRDMMERLRQMRQQELSRYDMGSVLDDIQQKLDEIVTQERSGIQKRLDDALNQQNADGDEQGAEGSQQSPDGEQQDGQQQSGERSAGRRGQQQEPPDDSLRRMLENIANRKNRYLDDMPNDPGGKIKSLQDYEFMDPQARQMFQDLMSQLQQRMLGNTFQGMMDSLKNMTPEDMAGLREMVKDLNEMLERHQRGEDPQFEQFMQKHGQYFPPGLKNIDDLIEHLAKQMARMNHLLNSMSPEQRKQLMDVMDALLRDDRLKWDLARLGNNLGQLFPMDADGFNFSGDEQVGMGEALDVMGRMQSMDELEADLRAAQSMGDLDKIDREQLRDLLGDDAAQSLDQLQQLVKMLEEAGYLERRGSRLELTPRGLRKIGQKALQDIFQQMKRDRFGNHETVRRGSGGERTDETKRYEFGDPFLLDLRETMMNAIERDGAGAPVHIQPDDFEVYRTELQSQSSTVLMIDMSRSMLLRGCWAAAKKVAMALDSLIRGQFPRDRLYIVGFALYAREMKPRQLADMDWSEYEYGTNLQHGLMLARQLLARQRGGNKQIIVITDGEPTAHVEDGDAYFNYPPTFRTIQETLREVVRCTKENIVINTFMLERGRSLMEFVNQMTQLNKGRAFFATPERLGEYVLVDYLAGKTKRVA
jgi:uncharacterized protein with von Willebrand factor type A (vWA) domain